MSLTFTNIAPADGAQVARSGALAFTLSSDVRDGQGVRVGVYVADFDTEEVAWNGLSFVGRYRANSVKDGDNFLIRRQGGWPTGGIALRVSELGSTEVMTIWTDGSGAPSNAVGEDGDYYLRTDTGQVYKRTAGAYAVIFTPIVPTTAAPIQGIGAGNTEGVASTFARSDHDHKLRTGTTDLTIGTLADGEYVKRSGTQLITAAITPDITALTGDVTASGSGSVVATIAAAAVTFAKMQNIATDTLIGRATAGAGDPETITCTAAGRALLDDADASAQRTTLGLGSIATFSSGALGGVAARRTVTGPASSNIDPATDHIIYVNTTSGAVTLTLPAHGTTDRIYEILDIAGTFGTNNCTLARSGGTGTIQGLSASYIMEAPFQSLRIASDGVSAWRFH